MSGQRRRAVVKRIRTGGDGAGTLSAGASPYFPAGEGAVKAEPGPGSAGETDSEELTPLSSPVEGRRPGVGVKRDASGRRIKSEKGEEASAAAPSAAPADWQQQYALIKQIRARLPPAPVETMGCAQLADRDAPAPVRRFHTLVGLLLSSQTRDEVTAGAVRRLQQALPGGLTVGSVLGAAEAELDRLIHPVGFHRTKAGRLRQVARLLRAEHGDDIPPDVAGLMALPGVGPKMAVLCAGAANGWDDPAAGIGVDVHVHRIAHRLGWTAGAVVAGGGARRKKGWTMPGPSEPPGLTAEQTRLHLQSWLPVELWREVNPLLVGFGQLFCSAARPRCGECELRLADVCPAYRERAGLLPKAEREREMEREVKVRKGAGGGPKIEIEVEGATIAASDSPRVGKENEEEEKGKGGPSRQRVTAPPPLPVRRSRRLAKEEQGKIDGSGV